MYYSSDGAKVYWNLSLEEIKQKLVTGVFITKHDVAYVHLPTLGQPLMDINIADIAMYAKVVPKCSNTEIPDLVHIPEHIEEDVIHLAALKVCGDSILPGMFAQERQDAYSVSSRIRKCTVSHFKELAAAASLSLGVLLFFATGIAEWYKNTDGKWMVDTLDLESGMMRHLLKTKVILPVRGTAIIWDTITHDEVIDIIAFKMAVYQPAHMRDIVDNVNNGTWTATAYEGDIKIMVDKEVENIKGRVSTVATSDAYDIRSFKLPACMRQLSTLTWHTRLVLANHVLWIKTVKIDALLSPTVLLEKIFTRQQLKRMSKSVRDFLAMTQRDGKLKKKPKCVSCRTIQNGTHETLACPYQSVNECASSEGKKLPFELQYNITPIGMTVLKSQLELE